MIMIRWEAPSTEGHRQPRGAPYEALDQWSGNGVRVRHLETAEFPGKVTIITIPGVGRVATERLQSLGKNVLIFASHAPLLDNRFLFRSRDAAKFE